MKEYSLIVSKILIVLLLTTSCNSFLDVHPKDQISRKEALAKQNGYYNALNGVYLLLGDNNLFGHHLTFGFIEQIARNHALKPAEAIFYWQYSSPELLPTTEAIWNKMYFAISNVNSVLEEIDHNKSVFDEGVYEIIKGELLTIRAYAHYTLLKLYAPDYNLNKEAKAIPYRTVYKNPKVTPFSSVEKVYEHLLADLKEAESLLADHDPVFYSFNDFDYANSIVKLIKGGSIMENRRMHFNYWCNIAIQARVHLSMSNYTDAYEYANKIIENESAFAWVTESSASSTTTRDILYYPEVISAIQVSTLNKNYTTYFKSELYVTTQDKDKDYVDKQVFESETIGSFDYRMQYQFIKNQNGKFAISQKYNQVNVSDINLYSEYTIVPTAKIGEMYLIAAEANCHLSPDDLSKSIELINELRIHRGNVSEMDPEISQEELLDFILKEFRRELYLEGQLFYQYKRHNLRSMPDFTEIGYIEVRENTYVLPIPKLELEEND